jgi:hypothetical protein
MNENEFEEKMGWGLSRIGWKFGMVEDGMSGCFVWDLGNIYFCFKKLKTVVIFSLFLIHFKNIERSMAVQMPDSESGISKNGIQNFLKMTHYPK